MKTQFYGCHSFGNSTVVLFWVSFIALFIPVTGKTAHEGDRPQIEHLEKRLDEMESRLKAVEKQLKAGDDRQKNPELVEPAFHEKIEGMWWAGEFLHVTYRGEMLVERKPLGFLQGYPDGFAFHPTSNRIAFSAGRGTTADMRMEYWSPSNQGPPVVKIQYNNGEAAPGQTNVTEENGFFWFFGGPMCFDANGVAYFSLGSCNPNGIYKVISVQPLKIEKLHALGSTSGLQVPLFDREHLYSTSHDGIYIYPMTASLENAKLKPWFSVSSPGSLLYRSLIISPTRIIVETLMPKPSKTEKRDYATRVLLFDKDSKAFWTLAEGELGPMAIAWDGKRMICFNQKNFTIDEFSLKEITGR